VALRKELAKLGFRPDQQLKEVLVDGHHSQSTLRVRQHRLMRATRLSPVQRLANLVEDVRRWIDEWFGRARKETESVQHAEKISPAPKETPGQKLRRVLEQKRQQHQQRRSGGIHI
jgi:hypothetical protein